MQNKSCGLYARFFKRFLDVVLSFIAIILLSPLFVILILLGSAFMRGNPFFTQDRPGYNGKVFKLIKFRTMDNRKDKDGNLLPDAVRLNGYGKLLRSTSLDEIPELINILKGDMSIIGPRPLLVKYLPYYTPFESKRHSVRPGLTGYAQCHGRNTLVWEERFEMDAWYVENIRLSTDIMIIFDSIKAVLLHDGVELNTLEDFDEYRRKQISEKAIADLKQ